MRFFAPKGRHVAPMGVRFGTAPPKSPPSCQISPPSVQSQGYRTPKLKFLPRFDQNVEYKRPARAHPLSDFHKICKIYSPFQCALVVKTLLDSVKGLWSYGAFKMTGFGYAQIFSAPSGETMCQTPKVLEVQERARGPLSPC